MAKTTKARRREVRNSKPKAGPPVVRWLRHPVTLQGGGLIAILALAGAMIALAGRARPPFEVGQVASETVLARVEFRAVDEQRTTARRNDAYDREPAVYVPNSEFFQEVREQLDALVRLAAAASIEEIPKDTRERLSLTPRTLEALRPFNNNGQATDAWARLTDQFLQEVAYIAVLSPERFRIETNPQQRAAGIVIQHPTLYSEHGPLDRNDIVLFSVSTDQRDELRTRIARFADAFPSTLREPVVELVMENLRPIYLYDEAKTRARKQAARDAVPNVEMTYEPNDVLVAAGHKITPLDLELVRHERRAYRQWLQDNPWQIAGLSWPSLPRGWLVPVGLVATFLAFGVGLWVYLGAYKSRIVENPVRGLAIVALLLMGQSLAVALTAAGPQYLFATAMFPALLIAMIVAIAYDQRLALAVGSLHAMMIAISLGLTVPTTIVMLAGVGVASSRLDKVRSRSKLISVGLWAGLAMAGAAIGVGAATRPIHVPGEVSRIGSDALTVLLTGVGTGLLVQGILPAIERLFKVTTALTLKDLNDASHPLLQRLAHEAPGTYQHSLRIADMAESAADSIGADGLLCRVGAMYHDIGKVNKPQYFIENQGGGPNRHAKLSPAMSLLIIVGHVKDGIEMAREYGLPPVLRHFIESHHGTTLVEYFYHAAKKKHEEQDTPAPADFEFRYPGPKPHTKEAAIMLLCDGCEAAARSLPEPTPVRIEQLVHSIATKRLMDGQFDECNMQLSELHAIEQAVVKTLTAVYHGRISYPSEKKTDSGEREQKQAATA